MSVDIKLPIGPFLRLSIVDYRATLPKGTELSAKMLEEALTSAHDAWHHARKKKRNTPVSEAEWLAELKADPILAGVDFNKQLALCQFWCRQQRPIRQCTRRTVFNWMKRAVDSAIVTAPGGGDPDSHAPKPDPGPKGWLEWTCTNIPSILETFAIEHPEQPEPLWHLLPDSHRYAVRSQMFPRK